LHSKIAIVATAGLLLVGAIFIFVFEYNNPLTIGEMSLFDKMQVSFFQSVTTRTAGFASVPQENLTNASAAVSVLLMMIGGSPVGTAGGMKTVTIAVLFCSAFATIRNKNGATLFGRRISEGSVRKAVAVAVKYCMEHPDTMLIVTSDHETGGVQLPKEGESVSNDLFTTEEHTDTPVRVFAVGQGSEYFYNKTVDNTDIAKFLISILES
jgi:Trk-type K+ transport system membrane component